jgi:hypothetical protein
MRRQSKLDFQDSSLPITPDILKALDGLTDAQAAEIAAARALWIDSRDRLTFAEKGMLAEYVDRRELWRHFGCQSLSEWIHTKCPYSHGSWFDAKRRWKELEDVPASDRVQIPRSNLIVMQKLSTAVRQDREVIEAAKTLPEAQFVERVQGKFPDQHLEPSRPVQIKADASAAKVIEEAVELAMRLGASNRSEALEDIAQNYIDDHRNEYDAMFQETA